MNANQKTKFKIIFITILFFAFFSGAGKSLAVDYFDWSTRLDRDGKPAGYLENTPFPVTETSGTYGITNDEGTHVYTLGAIYFVDGTLSGTCSGAYDPAARLCSGGSYIAYKSIAAALSGASAGNKTLLIRSGTYAEHSLSVPTGIDDAHRYSLIGYGQERPVIDGDAGILDIFSISGASTDAYVTFQRLEIKNAGARGIVIGGWINGNPGIEQHVNIVDTYFHDIGLDNVSDGAILFADADYGWVYHSTVWRTENHGIKISDDTDNTLIEWSEIHETGYWENGGDVHQNHAIALDYVSHESEGDAGTGNVGRYNIIYDTFSYGIDIEHQENFNIHHNEIYNTQRVYDVNADPDYWVSNSTMGANAIQFQESTNGRFHSNIIRDKRGEVGQDTQYSNEHALIEINSNTAALGIGPILIYNNLLYQANGTGVEQGIQITGSLSPGQTVDVSNNTLYMDTAGSPDTLLDVDWSGAAVTIRNNILYQAGSGSVWNLQSSNTHTNNLVYYPIGTIGHAKDATDISSDPLFVQIPSGAYDPNDVNISAGSPARDAGADLSALFSDSFNSVLRAAWDIGAYEFVESSPDTTPPSAPTGLSVN